MYLVTSIVFLLFIKLLNSQLFLKKGWLFLKAIHVLSHNAVLLRDEKGRKCIVTGKGIGFRKEKGDRVNQKLIRNIFVEERYYADRRTD